MDSVKPMVTQIFLVKISESQDKTKQECKIYKEAGAKQMWEGNEREVARRVIYTYEVVKENKLHINVKNYRTHTKADEHWVHSSATECLPASRRF